MHNAAYWYFSLLIFQLSFLALGLLSNYFAMQGGCTFKVHRLLTRVRFLSSLAVFGGSIICVIVIATRSRSPTVEVLAQHACSEDPVFNTSLANMGKYMDNSPVRLWLSTVLLSVILVLDIM